MLTVRRDAQGVPLRIRLVRAPNTPAPDVTRLNGDNPFAGITAENLSPAVAEELSSVDNRDGVVITDIAAESNAASVAFQKGDVILAVNGRAIRTTADLKDATSGQHYYWKLSIARGDQVIDTVLNN